jgi:methionine-gamma-lyase
MPHTFQPPEWPEVKAWKFNRNGTLQQGAEEDLSFETRLLHAGYDPLADAANFRSFVPPLVQSVTYPYERFEKVPDFVYGRSQNPTNQVLEKRLASLEGGEAAITACSGSQAVFNLILTLTAPGDNVVTSLNTFGEGYQQAAGVFPKHCGVSFRFVRNPADPADWERAIDEHTRLVWVETPSNPCLFITDIRAVAEVAHAGGVPLMVDNTAATAALQKPLELGADIVCLSISKFLCGNATVLGGAVVGPLDLVRDIRFNTNEYVGAILQPFDAWLTLHFIESLSLRMQRHSANAQQVAEFLAGHPAVMQVNYPGLESHPGHALARRQMSAMGGLLSFEVSGGMQEAARVMDGLRLIARAVTFGTSRSLCMHPATITHAEMKPEERQQAGITEGLLRLSVGLESPDDIIADLGRALG